MENVAIKRRGGNDVQHKNWEGKILRISAAFLLNAKITLNLLTLFSCKIICYFLARNFIYWFHLLFYSDIYNSLFSLPKGYSRWAVSISVKQNTHSWYYIKLTGQQMLFKLI